MRRRGCEWWNESVERDIKEKKELFENNLPTRNGMANVIYKGKMTQTKMKIKDAKKEANEIWGRRIMQKFKGNKNMFWIEVKTEKKLKGDGQSIALE